MHFVIVDLSVLLLSDIFQLLETYFPRNLLIKPKNSIFAIAWEAPIPKRGRGLGKRWIFFSAKHHINKMLQDPAEMTGNALTAKCQARQLYYLQRVSSDKTWRSLSSQKFSVQ